MTTPERRCAVTVTITVRVLGLELLHVWLSTDETAAEPDGSGTTGSTPVGFVAALEVPALASRC